MYAHSGIIHSHLSVHNRFTILRLASYKTLTCTVCNAIEILFSVNPSIPIIYFRYTNDKLLWFIRYIFERKLYICCSHLCALSWDVHILRQMLCLDSHDGNKDEIRQTWNNLANWNIVIIILIGKRDLKLYLLTLQLFI